MHHYLLSDFVAQGYLVLSAWLQLQIIDQHGSKLIRLVVWVANIPFKNIIEPFVIQHY
jgi:hypothetical protein